MSKISAAFGGGKVSSKPSTTEIFLALAEKAKNEAKLKEEKLKFKTQLQKLAGGRAHRLGAGGKQEDEEDKIALLKRPGARSAKLLGA